MTEPAPPKSDLGVRVLSAVVMIAVAGTALWLGGAVWAAFVAAVAMGALWEWRGLVRRLTDSLMAQTRWMVGGILYIGSAAAVLLYLRDGSALGPLLIVSAVVGTDVGAYFAGRSIGGPKIAPSISPSKTWAGLIGGVLGAAVLLGCMSWVWNSGLCDVFHLAPALDDNKVMFDGPCSWVSPPIPYLIRDSVIVGTLAAIVAQAGDFFESSMKRRANVKDSGTLIPGHGGLLDRVDGLLAVAFAVGITALLSGALF